MTPKKQTPLTMEMFQKQLLPRIEEIMGEKIEKVTTNFRSEVLGFKVEVLGEIKGLREEVTTALGQYKRTNRRVDRIEKYLNLSSQD